MHPFLDQNVGKVPYIGRARETILNDMGIATVEDLLTYFPRRYLDRTTIKSIGNLVTGEECTVVGEVVNSVLQQHRRRKILHVTLRDATGYMTLNWFQGHQWIQKVLKPGETISVSGKVDFFRGHTMTHPDFDFVDRDQLNTGMLVPVYPLTQELRKRGLNSRVFRRIFNRLFNQCPPQLPDPLPDDVLHQIRILPYRDALYQMHFPDDEASLKKGWFRFKFQELFMLQLLLAIKKKTIREQKSPYVCSHAGDLIHKLYHSLPFDLTNAQKRVIREIYEDLRSGHIMNRLLQGDVGSGKTLVAAAAAAIMIDNGYQSAIMAPTEILANQHYINFNQLFMPLNIPVALLTGRLGAAQKRESLTHVANGQTPIVIGTHALIQEGVTFSKLGFVVVDEQHRFGVDQRGLLIKKGMNPHVLSMTATPIPRTLSLSLYGDMDVSILDEMPPGRKTVRTRVVTPGGLALAYDFIRKEVRKGRQIYVVYPLISESEKMDLKAAEAGYEELRDEIFPDLKVALLHGRTPSREKEAVMQDFKGGKIHILVSTTVIEVGVDVPNASIMMIENAERFGLTQLHQLRGRVGRGAEQSYCLLVNRKNTEQGNTRLRILEKSSDGFEIAEADLQLRGPGEFFSTRQHGDSGLKIADLVSDMPIMIKARKEAFKLVEKDPQILLPRHRNLLDFFLKHYRDKLDYATIG
ncbi:ATP-dependent DNA helicase RecG [Fidelibacter multiformis]|uniref:ATP-dependent DNA helicase RecG n=1 Tax=Fidelibacter multiformis TaxID=3377529 RepID=UPI0037DC6ACF